jgi:hypothetical protein
MLENAISQIAKQFNHEKPLESLTKKDRQNASSVYLYKKSLDRDKIYSDPEQSLRNMRVQQEMS